MLYQQLTASNSFELELRYVSGDNIDYNITEYLYVPQGTEFNYNPITEQFKAIIAGRILGFGVEFFKRYIAPKCNAK